MLLFLLRERRAAFKTNSLTYCIFQFSSTKIELPCVVRMRDADLNYRRWHVTISSQPDGRPPQPFRPWKSGRVHLADGIKVVVLELPYSTEFGRESRKFASGVRKYGKFVYSTDSALTCDD